MFKKGKTKSGFEFEIDTEVFDDMEFLDLIAEADGENPTALSKVVTVMLGNQKKKLYEHLRNEAGRVPISAITTEIVEIFGSLGEEGKK